MSSFLRHPGFRIGLAGLLILLIEVQPNWLPLLTDLQTASAAPVLTTEGYLALQDAYTRQPWHPDRAKAAGLAALAAQNYDQAVAILNVAAANGGWTPDLRLALGDAYNGQGRRAEAIAEWAAARSAQPDNVALLSRLAIAYEAEQDYPQAAEALRLIVVHESDNAIAHYRLGLILTVLDPPAAQRPLATAATLDPTVAPFADSVNKAVAAGLQLNDEAYTDGIIGYTLIGLREYALAKAALLRAIEKRPSFADAYAYLGLAEDNLGNDGQYAYERALDINDQIPIVHYLFGLHYRRKGENDRAIPALQTAFELDPANAAAAAELGSAYRELADLIAAEEWYRQAVRVAPDNANFWLLLARFYLEQDLRVEQAGLLSAQQAAQLAPDSAQAADTLGYAYYLNADWGNAEANLLKAIELDPRLGSAYLHIGLVQLETNRPEAARANLETAVSLDAGGPVAEQAFKALARLGIPTTPAP